MCLYVYFLLCSLVAHSLVLNTIAGVTASLYLQHNCWVSICFDRTAVVVHTTYQ